MSTPKRIEDVAVVIQARLSSQRVPRKMIEPFAGSNLTEIAVKKILDSTVIPKENFYLSVHESELVAVGTKLGVNIFERSERSALWDGGPGAELVDMYEWWDKVPHKYVVLVSACAPMLTTETIDKFFQEYLQTESDGMFAVMEKKNYFWNTDGKMLNSWPETETALNTKAVETTYEAAPCLYAGRLASIGQGIWMGDFSVEGDIELVPVPEGECYDIDYPWQFELYEIMYNQLKGKL